jgi:hypothetical protein
MPDVPPLPDPLPPPMLPVIDAGPQSPPPVQVPAAVNPFPIGVVHQPGTTFPEVPNVQ